MHRLGSEETHLPTAHDIVNSVNPAVAMYAVLRWGGAQFL